MKKSFCGWSLSVVVVSFLASGALAHAEDREVIRWTSPDGGHALVLRARATDRSSPDMTVPYAVAGGKELPVTDSPLIESPFRREYAGTEWLKDQPGPRWLTGQLALFEHTGESGNMLAVVDTDKAVLLLNENFLALSKRQGEGVWAALRDRPAGRHQELLDPSFNDTLLIIRPGELVEAADKAIAVPQPEVFSHLRSLKLPGIALTAPVWRDRTKGGLVLAIWNGKSAEGLLVDDTSLKIIAKKPLPVKVTREQALKLDLSEGEKADWSAFARVALTDSVIAPPSTPHEAGEDR
ncbi:MAG: hypothetical protein QM755_24495 [Luteolibacter sp.]